LLRTQIATCNRVARLVPPATKVCEAGVFVSVNQAAKFLRDRQFTMLNASMASEEPSSGTLRKSLWMTRIRALVMVPFIVGG
jgi:hypothetical protein